MKKRVLACLLLAILSSLCLYSFFAFDSRQYLSLPGYNRNNRQSSMDSLLMGKIVYQEPGKFVLSSDHQNITVFYQGAVRNAKFGITAVYGRYTTEAFQAYQVIPMDYNHGKYMLSVFAILIFAYFLRKEWTLRSCRLGERNA